MSLKLDCTKVLICLKLPTTGTVCSCVAAGQTSNIHLYIMFSEGQAREYSMALRQQHSMCKRSTEEWLSTRTINCHKYNHVRLYDNIFQVYGRRDVSVQNGRCDEL